MSDEMKSLHIFVDTDPQDESFSVVFHDAINSVTKRPHTLAITRFGEEHRRRIATELRRAAERLEP